MKRCILQLVFAVQCLPLLCRAEAAEDTVVDKDVKASSLPAEIAQKFKLPFRLDKNKAREIAPKGTTYILADNGWRTTILRDASGKKISVTIVYPHPDAEDIYQVGWSRFDDEKGWLKGTGKGYKGKDADSMTLLVHSILGQGFDKKLDRLVGEIQKRYNNKGCSGVEERDLRLHP